VTGGRKLTVDSAGELNKKADEIKAVDGKMVTTTGGPTAHQAGGLMYLTGKPMNINGVGKVEIVSGGAKVELVSGSVVVTGGPIRLKGDVIVEKDLNVDGNILCKGSEVKVKGKLTDQ
jgi:hypothetical protein